MRNNDRRGHPRRPPQWRGGNRQNFPGPSRYRGQYHSPDGYPGQTMPPHTSHRNRNYGSSEMRQGRNSRSAVARRETPRTRSTGSSAGNQRVWNSLGASNTPPTTGSSFRHRFDQHDDRTSLNYGIVDGPFDGVNVFVGKTKPNRSRHTREGRDLDEESLSGMNPYVDLNQPPAVSVGPEHPPGTEHTGEPKDPGEIDHHEASSSPHQLRTQPPSSATPLLPSSATPLLSSSATPLLKKFASEDIPSKFNPKIPPPSLFHLYPPPPPGLYPPPGLAPAERTDPAAASQQSTLTSGERMEIIKSKIRNFNRLRRKRMDMLQNESLKVQEDLLKKEITLKETIKREMGEALPENSILARIKAEDDSELTELFGKLGTIKHLLCFEKLVLVEYYACLYHAKPAASTRFNILKSTLSTRQDVRPIDDNVVDISDTPDREPVSLVDAVRNISQIFGLNIQSPIAYSGSVQPVLSSDSNKSVPFSGSVQSVRSFGSVQSVPSSISVKSVPSSSSVPSVPSFISVRSFHYSVSNNSQPACNYTNPTQQNCMKAQYSTSNISTLKHFSKSVIPNSQGSPGTIQKFLSGVSSRRFLLPLPSLQQFHNEGPVESARRVRNTSSRSMQQYHCGASGGPSRQEDFDEHSVAYQFTEEDQAALSAASPGRPAASLGRSEASTGQSSASPGQSAANPGRSAASPDQSAASPGRSAASPGRSAVSPGLSMAGPALCLSAEVCGITAARQRIEEEDFKSEASGLFKLKFKNLNQRFKMKSDVSDFFVKFGRVKDLHLEDEMPFKEDYLLREGDTVYVVFVTRESFLSAVNQSLLECSVARVCLTPQGLLKFGYTVPSGEKGREEDLESISSEETPRTRMKRKRELSRGVEDPIGGEKSKLPRPSSRTEDGEVGGLTRHAKRQRSSRDFHRPRDAIHSGSSEDSKNTDSTRDLLVRSYRDVDRRMNIHTRKEIIVEMKRDTGGPRLWECSECKEFQRGGVTCKICHTARPDTWMCRPCSWINYPDNSVCSKCHLETSSRGTLHPSPHPSNCSKSRHSQRRSSRSPSHQSQHSQRRSSRSPSHQSQHSQRRSSKSSPHQSQHSQRRSSRSPPHKSSGGRTVPEDKEGPEASARSRPEEASCPEDSSSHNTGEARGDEYRRQEQDRWRDYPGKDHYSLPPSTRTDWNQVEASVQTSSGDVNTKVVNRLLQLAGGYAESSGGSQAEPRLVETTGTRFGGSGAGSIVLDDEEDDDIEILSMDDNSIELLSPTLPEAEPGASTQHLRLSVEPTEGQQAVDVDGLDLESMSEEDILKLLKSLVGKAREQFLKKMGISEVPLQPDSSKPTHSQEVVDLSDSEDELGKFSPLYVVQEDQGKEETNQELNLELDEDVVFLPQKNQTHPLPLGQKENMKDNAKKSLPEERAASSHENISLCRDTNIASAAEEPSIENVNSEIEVLGQNVGTAHEESVLRRYGNTKFVVKQRASNQKNSRGKCSGNLVIPPDNERNTRGNCSSHPEQDTEKSQDSLVHPVEDLIKSRGNSSSNQVLRAEEEPDSGGKDSSAQSAELEEDEIVILSEK